MITIYKYPVTFNEIQSIILPLNAKILTVQTDQKTMSPCIWAMVDTLEEKKEQRNFILYGTGYPMLAVNQNYIGTFQYQKGEFIGHLFEKL